MNGHCPYCQAPLDTTVAHDVNNCRSRNLAVAPTNATNADIERLATVRRFLYQLLPESAEAVLLAKEIDNFYQASIQRLQQQARDEIKEEATEEIARAYGDRDELLQLMACGHAKANLAHFHYAGGPEGLGGRECYCTTKEGVDEFCSVCHELAQARREQMEEDCRAACDFCRGTADPEFNYHDGCQPIRARSEEKNRG